MARNRKSDNNPIAPGAIGAAAGAIVGGVTGVLLSNKDARKKVTSGFNDVKEYAQEAFSAMNTAAEDGINTRRLARVGVKGGASKIKSLKQRYGKKGKGRS